MFTKEIRVLRLQNRISKLSVNPDNNKIVKKLERELRNLDK